MNRFAMCGVISVAVFLSGCGGGVLESGEMRVTASSGSSFSGVAGSAWSEDEIRDTAGRNACGGELPARLTVTKTEAGQDFAGEC